MCYIEIKPNHKSNIVLTVKQTSTLTEVILHIQPKVVNPVPPWVTIALIHPIKPITMPLFSWCFGNMTCNLKP